MAKPSGQSLHWDRNSQCQQTAEEIKCKFDGAASKPWQTDLWCYPRVSLQCIENSGVFLSFTLCTLECGYPVNEWCTSWWDFSFFYVMKNYGPYQYFTHLRGNTTSVTSCCSPQVMPRLHSGNVITRLSVEFCGRMDSWENGWGGCTGIPAAPWWLLIVTYRGTANCSNEGGQLGGSQPLCRNTGQAFILWELRADTVSKPSQGKVVWDGTKCFPVALGLKCRDWANCLEFGILSLENEDRALLSYSIFQLMFPRHFTDILFPSIKVLCINICTI